MRTVRTAAVLAALTLATAACGAQAGDGAASPTPSGSVRFAADVQPILSASCALSSCHSGAQPVANLDLSSGHAWTDTVGVAGYMYSSYLRVNAGDPSSSLIYLKITGSQNVGFAMPQGVTASVPPLDANQVETIRRWILEGAPND